MISLHNVESFLFGLHSAQFHILLLNSPYLACNNPFQIDCSLVTIHEIHLESKALLNLQMSLTPNPPNSFGLQIVSQLTKASPLFSTPP